MIRTLYPSGQDDTWILARTLRDAQDLDTVVLTSGTYRLSAPLTCLDKRLLIMGDGAVLRSNIAAGPALTIGYSANSPLAGGQGGFNWTIRGLGLTFGGTGGTYMNNTVTGLQIQNVYGGVFDNLRMDGWNVALSVQGLGVGCTANSINVSSAQNNQTIVSLSADATGYNSENTFWGGNWGWGPIGSGKAATCVLSTSGRVHAARFNAVTFQAWPDVTWANLASCDYFVWLSCRFETTDASVVPIVLPASTSHCTVMGVTSPCVSFTDQSGGANGHVFLPNWK